MSLDLVERIVTTLFENGACARKLDVVWHAGEPLVLPPGYYEDAFRRIARAQPREVEILHHIQTNGVLIDQDWCDLFARWHVALGVSIDGPAELHDQDRVTRHGMGTHEQVMRAIALLNARGIPFHVITVLTARALEFPDELYDFYLSAEIRRVGFNIEEIEGLNRVTSLAGDDVDWQFRRFFRRFWLLAADDPRLEVREVAWARRACTSGTSITNEQTAPFVLLSVDWQGRWSTFSPELLGAAAPAYDNFIFGNFRNPKPLDIESTAFTRALEDIRAGIVSCEGSCAYFRWCGGGAPANKWFETGTLRSTETLYCRLCVKGIMDVAHDVAIASSDPADEAGLQSTLTIGSHPHFLGPWESISSIEVEQSGEWREPKVDELTQLVAPPPSAQPNVRLFTFPGYFTERLWDLEVERILREQHFDLSTEVFLAHLLDFLAFARIMSRPAIDARFIAVASGASYELSIRDVLRRAERSARRAVLNLSDECLFVVFINQGVRVKLGIRQGLSTGFPVRLEAPGQALGGALILAITSY